jgi:hypothetical protein
MAASAKLIIGPRVFELSNEGTSGKKPAMVISEVTYDSDATCQVPVPLSEVHAVSGCCADVSAPAADVIGCDRIKDSGTAYNTGGGAESTSYYTVATTASNSNTYRLTFWGYV